MNKPVKKMDAQLLEYLQALQQPTPAINPLPANPAWNNHPKLNPMQQKFYQEQQHMMRTEWQLMQEKRLQEERQLTQSHHSGGGGGPPKKQTTPVPAPVIYANICVSGAGSPPANGTYAYNAPGKFWVNNAGPEQRIYYSVANSRWQMDVFVAGIPVLNIYNNAAANGINPPTTGWTRGSGSNPAPTIAYAAC